MRPTLDKLRAHLTPRLARAYGLAGPRLNLAQADPVVVLGNQKTGSSAIAGLLAARTGRSLAADVHGAWQMEPALATGALPSAAFVQRHRYYFRHAIVKENSLTLAADALLAALPRARPVFTLRHPLHNLRSILDRLGWPAEPQPIPTLPPISHAWRAILDLRPWGVDADDQITALAERWRLTAEAALRHQTRAVWLRYEDFLADKTTAIDQLAEHLGLVPTHPIEGLLDHAFQPRGARRAKPLDAVFPPTARAIVQQICGPLSAEIGYELVSP